MRRTLLLLLCSVSLVLHGQVTFPENGAPRVDNSLYVLRDATVHINHLSELNHADVWIQDGQIIKVSQEAAVPSYAIVKDCKGKHIYASFIELHSDYGLQSNPSLKRSGPSPERSEKGLYGWNEAVRPERAAMLGFAHEQSEKDKLRQAGIGAVLSHHQDGVIRGTASVITLGDRSEQESVIKDRAAQFLSFEKGSSQQDYPRSKMGAIALIRQSFYDQEWYSNGGVSQEYNLSLEALSQNRSLPQFMVTREKNDILRAKKIAEEFGLKMHFIGSGNEYERAQDMATAGGTIVLPLDFPEAYDLSDPYTSKYVSLHEMRQWEQAPYNAAYLEALGVEIAFTSQGLKEASSFLPAIRQCIDHGLSTKAALKALTVTPASILGIGDRLGEVKAGAVANLIVSDLPIFDKKSKILEHWVHGKEFVIQGNDDTDITGIYDLNLDGARYSLTVMKHKAHVIISGDTNKVKVDIQELDRQVNMVFEHPERGLYRLHGNLNRRLNIWSGGGVSPSGKDISWNCVRKGDVSKQDEKDKEEDHEKVSALSYPNNGYGWREAPQAEHLLITNATVWTNGPEGVLQDADVLMSNGKILAVGHNLNVADVFAKSKEKPNVRKLDAYGKHVTSGIIDEHSHIAISRGVNEGTQASSAEVRIGDVVDPEDLDIYYQLAGGVTASQLLHGSANPIGGQSALIKLRWGRNAEQMKIDGADGFIKFALGENVKQSNWGNNYRTRFPQTRMGVEQVYYDHFHRARDYYQEQQAFLGQNNSKRNRKKGPTLNFRRDLEMEALSEILYQKRFITCHSYVQSEINMLMHVADSMNFTVNTFTHILEGYKVADKMKAHGAGGSTFSDWWAYKYEVREAIPYNAALMHEQGVTVAINSDDAEMGRRLNQEAAKGVKYGGMSEEDAWKMVTLNPAKLLHLDDRMGSLEVGKDADVVIWDGNPLSVQAHVEQTFIDGVRYYDHETNLRRSEELKKERSRLAQKMIQSKGPKRKKSAPDDKHRYHCDTMEP